MNEEVLNKWKDVSPEDITSEPNWKEGWELVHASVREVLDEQAKFCNLFERVEMIKWKRN